MSGGGVTYYVEQARERSNARMIVIDPRYNDTAAGVKMNGCPFATAPMAHWPVRLPGTDY